MEASQLNWVAGYIWSIAHDVLRDLYVRGIMANPRPTIVIRWYSTELQTSALPHPVEPMNHMVC